VELLLLALAIGLGLVTWGLIRLAEKV